MEVNNGHLSDAVDIILLLDPNKRNASLRQLDFSTRLKIKKQKPLRFHVVAKVKPKYRFSGSLRSSITIIIVWSKLWLLLMC